MKPFPISDHTGDRELARTLLFEHGLDPTMADRYNPQVIEILAATTPGGLTEARILSEDSRWRAQVLDNLQRRRKWDSFEGFDIFDWGW